MGESHVSLYKRLFRIAVPVAIQQFIFTSVNFVDTLMIGTLGETAIAAVGLSNQLFFLYNLVIFGLASGGAIFFAQYWGKGDIEGIARSTALTSLLALVFSTPFFVLSFFFPGFTLRFFSPDPAVITVGIPYLKIVALSYPFFAMTFVMSMVLRSIEHAIVPMLTSILEVATNVLLNYGLIFGKLGMPRLGVYGAGVATSLARMIGFVALLSVILFKKYPGRFGWRHISSLSSKFVAHFLRYTFPTVANEFAWAAGVTMYSVIYAHMSTQAVAARNVMSTIEGFAFSFTFALASAAGVVVGKELGASRFKEAYEDSKRILKLILMVAVVSGLVIVGITYGVIGFFNISLRAREMVLAAMIISAAFMPVKSFSAVNIVGFLRAGGDTRFSFLLEASTLWFVGVPLCALGGLILKLDFPVVYLLTMAEESLKAMVLIYRFKSRKWVRNVVEKTYEFETPHV